MGRNSVSLFIRNVSDECRQEDLKDEFSRFGEVSDVYIPLDYYSKRPRGFAYVQFEHVRDAEDALDRMDQKVICGKKLQVQFAAGDRKAPHQMRRDGRYESSRSGGYRHRSRSPRYRDSRYSRSPRRRDSHYSSSKHRSPSPRHYSRSSRNYDEPSRYRNESSYSRRSPPPEKYRSSSRRMKYSRSPAGRSPRRSSRRSSRSPRRRSNSRRSDSRDYKLVDECNTSDEDKGSVGRRSRSVSRKKSMSRSVSRRKSMTPVGRKTLSRSRERSADSRSKSSRRRSTSPPGEDNHASGESQEMRKSEPGTPEGSEDGSNTPKSD